MRREEMMKQRYVFTMTRRVLEEMTVPLDVNEGEDPAAVARRYAEDNDDVTEWDRTYGPIEVAGWPLIPPVSDTTL
jgi:hypothetical protein